MRRFFNGVLALMVLVSLAHALKFYWRNFRGSGPAFRHSRDAADFFGRSETPLRVPIGFSLSVLASRLGNPRVMVLDPKGRLVVSLTENGKVVAVTGKERIVTVLDHLNRPHGLAFRVEGRKQFLYVAETDRVARYDYDPVRLRATLAREIAVLPEAGRHFTRTLLFLPPPAEGRLLISVGSSCDVCVEKDWRRAKILVTDADGNGLAPYASGLRNSVFLAAHPVTREVWATENGRDFLGDELPPDEMNIIHEGKNYGWPYCYGKNLHDDTFDRRWTHPCTQTSPSTLDIQAHSAPLGLAFFPKEGWPEEFRYNLLVAYHGSWNRSVPTGYKVVRYRLDPGGNVLGMEDFMTGWLLNARETIGRPAGILIRPHGVLYVSDDKAGVIYELKYRGKTFSNSGK